jgi:hypothetical protein
MAHRLLFLFRMKNMAKTTQKKIPTTLREADLKRVSGGGELPTAPTEGFSLNFIKISH